MSSPLFAVPLLFMCTVFFPVTSFFLSVLFLGLTARQNLYNIQLSVRRRLLSVPAVFIMVLLGFCSADLRTASQQPISDIAGETDTDC